MSLIRKAATPPGGLIRGLQFTSIGVDGVSWFKWQGDRFNAFNINQPLTMEEGQMKNAFRVLYYLSLFYYGLAVTTVQATVQIGKVMYIFPPASATVIQNAIDSLPAAGGTIIIQAGEYTLSKGIHIHRSNISLKGEPGTLLTLADHVNEPVILIGTDVMTPSLGDTISNIRIANMEIDGNRSNQDAETDPARPWIRNNGIDVRSVTSLWIDNVNVHDTVSGGLVVSWYSRHIFVNHSLFHHNDFDGIALYASQDIIVSDFICYENDSAGLSLDNELHNVIFSSGIVRDNKDVGIFIRDSNDLSFYNLSIFKNESHGCFMSHAAPGTDTGVTRVIFSSCSFLANLGDGLHLASTTADSPSNAITGCLFSGNTGLAVFVISGGALDQTANIYQ
jgi:hypothetical protein